MLVLNQLWEEFFSVGQEVPDSEGRVRGKGFDQGDGKERPDELALVVPRGFVEPGLYAGADIWVPDIKRQVSDAGGRSAVSQAR